MLTRRQTETMEVHAEPGGYFTAKLHPGPVRVRATAIGCRSTPPSCGRAESTWTGSLGFVGGIGQPTGLTHLGAREWRPDLGRFLSIDPKTHSS